MYSVTDKQLSLEPMTDRQIKAMATDEWMETLMSLWSAIGKDANDDEKRLTIYARQFAIVPLGILEKAVDRAIRNNGKYLTVPTASVLWDAVRKELDIQPHEDVEGALQRWKTLEAEMFEGCIVRFG
jgi:hypothetical protein